MIFIFFPVQASKNHAVDASAAHRQLGTQLARGALVTLGILSPDGSSTPQGPNPPRGTKAEEDVLAAAATLDAYTLQFMVRCGEVWELRLVSYTLNM